MTDPDSRLLYRPGRAGVQGYNAQAVATAEQIIIAAEITQQANDSSQLEPMIGAAIRNIAEAGIDEPIGAALADGGYWNSGQITALREQGITPIAATKAATQNKPRILSAKQGPEADRIDRLLDTPEGQALYRRQQLIEPDFANTKVTRGIRRFQRRGLAACTAEWQLIAATHNLLKLWRLAQPPPPDRQNSRRRRNTRPKTTNPATRRGLRNSPSTARLSKG